jgi:hypothetical protein
MIKNVILLISLIGSLLFYLLFVSKTIYICDIYCSDATDYYHRTTLFFPFVFIFSLITYSSPDRVFQSWWKFARIAIPVCFFLSLLVNLDLLISPDEQWPALVNGPAIFLIYSTFTLGSIWQIWKGFRQR